jgi:hypothetical protein
MRICLACLLKKRDAELGVGDLYAHYQSWCRLNHVRPFSSEALSRVAKAEIEITVGLKVRHLKSRTFDLCGGSSALTISHPVRRP